MDNRRRPSPEAIAALRTLQQQAIHDFGLVSKVTNDNAADIALIAAARLRAPETVGAPPIDFEKEHAAALQQVRRALGAETPTEYQDPLDYAIMSDLDRVLREKNARVSNHGLPDAVLLGSLPIGQANALTLHLPETDEYLILFQQGLFGALNLFAAVLMSVWPEEAGGLPLLPERAAVARAIDADPDLVGDFLAALRGILVEGNPRRVMPRPLSPIRAGSKETLLQYAEMFVLGHEYGHIRRGHFQERNAVTAKCGNRALTITSRSHQDEFGADMHALEWLTLAGLSDPVQTYLACQGATLFLTCQEIWEEALVLLEGSSYAERARDTHPTGSQRLKALAEVLSFQIGVENARLVLDGCSRVGDTLRTIWERSRNGWLALCRGSGVRAASIWKSAVESQTRPSTDGFQEDPPDHTLKELGLPGTAELEGLKGPAFLTLLDLGSEDADTRKAAAQAMSEQAHVVTACLISEFAGREEQRKEAFTGYLLNHLPGLRHWIMQLRFVLARYPGNPDIFGVPEVFLQFGLGMEYLRAIASRVAKGDEIDYVRLFVDLEYAFNRTVFKKG